MVAAGGVLPGRLWTSGLGGLVECTGAPGEGRGAGEEGEEGEEGEVPKVLALHVYYVYLLTPCLPVHLLLLSRHFLSSVSNKDNTIFPEEYREIIQNDVSFIVDIDVEEGGGIEYNHCLGSWSPTALAMGENMQMGESERARERKRGRGERGDLIGVTSLDW